MPVSFTLPVERVFEKATVFKQVSAGLPVAVFGPAPPPPHEWTDFIAKAKQVWGQAAPSREVIEGLHEEWEDLAHREVPALFQRKKQAGGALQVREQILQEALSARNTLRPTPSLAAAVLTRTLGSALSASNETVWRQIENTITSKKRDKWFRLHLMLDNTPEWWQPSDDQALALANCRDTYSYLKALLAATPRIHHQGERPDIQVRIDKLKNARKHC